MPIEVTHTLYTFDELSDRAKNRAREWYRQGALDYDWWDSVYDDAAECGRILGIDIRQKPVRLMSGATRYDPSIWFSGFSHQGQGSAFDGSYQYAKGSVKAIKAHAPQDTELHAIAEKLYVAQRRSGFKISAVIKAQRDTWLETETDGPWQHDAKAVQEAMDDFNHWIFCRLRDEYEYLLSDESVDDSIRANEYTFDGAGNRDD